MKNALLRLTVLLLVPLAAIYAADRPTAKLDAATPPGKTYIYKHSAGQPREMEIYSRPTMIRPKPKCLA